MLRTSCLDIPKAECIFYTFYFQALMNRVQELGENSGFPQALLSRIRLLELIFFKFSVYRCMIFPCLMYSVLAHLLKKKTDRGLYYKLQPCLIRAICFFRIDLLLNYLSSPKTSPISTSIHSPTPKAPSSSSETTILTSPSQG